MADWYRIKIEWVANKPTEEQERRLHRLIAEQFDYDFPYCFHHETNYRSPLLTLQEILNICHHFGFMCRGYMVDSRDWEIGYHDQWQLITGKISNNDLRFELRRNVDIACSEMYGGKL